MSSRGIFHRTSSRGGLSDVIVSAGADEAACEDLNLDVERTFCRRVHCTNFDSEFIIYPLAVGVFVVMAVLYGKICRRLRATSIIDGGRFMMRQYRGIRTSVIVLSAFLVAWLPYCLFETTIFIPHSQTAIDTRIVIFDEYLSMFN